VDPPSHGKDIHIIIGGIEYTDNLRNDSLAISDEIGTRNVCTFTLIDRTKSLFFPVGPVVRVWYDDVLIFAGTVDEIRENIVGDVSDTKEMRFSCVDWNQMADRHIVAFRADTANQTAGDVFTTIVNSQSGDANENLVDEGITTSGVTPGPVVSTISFNYKPASECFDDLADLVGYSWFFDYNKDAKFFDVSTYYAPVDLDDTTWQEYRKLELSRGRDEYRNIQHVQAGKAISNTRTDFFTGNSKDKQYLLALDLAEKPRLYVDDVEVNSTYIDIRRSDEDQDTIEWFYEIGTAKITQNSDDTAYPPLTASEELKVSYKGFYPIALQGRDDDEISTRKGIESDAGVSTGVYANVESKEEINDLDLALEYMNSLLRRYARIETVVSYETDEWGFRSGQRLTVNVPELAMAGDFLITRVNFRYLGDTLFRYQITAVKGLRQGGWADFYKRLATKGRPFTIQEDETLNLARTRQHPIAIGDAVSMSTPLYSWSLDPYRHWIVGESKIGGRRQLTIADALDSGVVYGPMIGWPYKQ